MFTVVSQKSCSICFGVKQALRSKKIQYTEYDVRSQEGTAIMNECNVKTLPIIIVDNIWYSGTEALKYVKGL